MTHRTVYYITPALEITIKEQATFFNMGAPYARLNSLIEHTRDTKRAYIPIAPLEPQEEAILQGVALKQGTEKGIIYCCEWCCWTGEYIEQYHNHILEAHGRNKFLEVARNDSEVTDLTELLPWINGNVELKTELPDSITAKYESDDMDWTEHIDISRDFNEYGVAYYTLTITQYNRYNDEIENDEASTQHMEDFDEGKIDEINQNFDKDIKDWESKKAINITDTYKQRLTVHTDIVDEYCYVNVSHYHYYKAITIKCETNRLLRVKAVIAARAEIAEIYLKAVEGA